MPIVKWLIPINGKLADNLCQVASHSFQLLY